MRAMKDSGIEWIGQIPQEWSLERLKFHADFNPATDIPSLLDDDDVSFIPMDHLKSGFHHQSMVPYQKVKKGYVTFNDGDVLMAKVTPCLENGNLAIAENLRDGIGFGSTEINVIRCHSVLNRYLFYLLQCPTYIKKATFNMFGVAGLKRLEPGFIPNSFFPIPPKEEQLKIAAYVDAKCAEIDALIAAKERTNALLNERRQSIIYEAVTKGLNPDAPMKDSGIEWIGQIPEHWTVKKIKYLGAFRNGLTYSPDNVASEGSGTLVLRSSNIQNGNIVFDDNVYVDMEIPENMQVAAGDILICSRNGSKELIGKNAIIPENINASFGAFMMIFRCGDPKYMYYILNSNVFSYYLGTFLTSTVNQLTAANFGNMKVVYCDSTEGRRRIVDYLDRECAELDSAISANEASIQKLKEYRQSIIYEAVTGKIEI